VEYTCRLAVQALRTTARFGIAPRLAPTKNPGGLMHRLEPTAEVSGLSASQNSGKDANGNSDTKWSLATRVAFRFMSVFLFLFLFPFLFEFDADEALPSV
jgi:hypothetical protein